MEQLRLELDPVVVVRSPRARRWRLEAPWGEPTRLVVPRRTSEREISEILDRMRTWVERERRRQVPRLDLHRLGMTEAAARRLARERVTETAAREAAMLGVAYARIAIRGQRTLWGSCSPRGTLSFNWRLALAPLDVLEYVVVHELCHLREPSHQKPFWRLLSAVRPGWQEQARWLREHGQELHDYDPSKAVVGGSY